METSESPSPKEAPAQEARELLLIIFIHGFKGTDTTFGEFPQRLQHVLSETLSNMDVECVTFPAYETKGELDAAVTRFADWLTSLTVEREVAKGLGGGAGKAKVVLCGHSMGGLLAADALTEFVDSRPDKGAPLWPRIVACIAFDTPYLGLHPFVFKNSASQVVNHVQTAKSLLSKMPLFGTSKAATAAAPEAAAIAAPPASPSSSWQKWAPAAYAVGGALIAGAAAGTAYYKREDLGSAYTWAGDHMKYVGTLWNEKRLKVRLEKLLDIENDMGVLFRNFYTFLPPRPPAFPTPRTFIVLPKETTILSQYFLQAPNSVAEDEVQAHIGMFGSKTNDGYYELGLVTAQIIRDAILASRAS